MNNAKTLFKLRDIFDDIAHTTTVESDNVLEKQDSISTLNNEVIITANTTEIKKIVYYACKTCRTNIITESEIETHNSLNTQGQNFEKSDLCQLVFIKDLQIDWIQNQITVSKADEGKLLCSKCCSKIGRWSLQNKLTCSCGAFHPYIPCVALKKKSLDLIVPSDIKELSLRLQENTIDENDDEEEPKNLQKKSKRSKTQQKKQNMSNMGNFRNKNYS